MPQAPNTEALDEHLKAVIQAVHGAVARAMPHLKDEPKIVDQAIADCEEILNEVMQGKVAGWLE